MSNDHLTAIFQAERDEARRERDDLSHRLVQLRAAIWALIESQGADGYVMSYILRNLLGDDGAAALRGVKAQVWDECAVDSGDSILFRRPNPYRDAAREAE